MRNFDNFNFGNSKQPVFNRHLTNTKSRLDSVSLVSRQSDLASRGWKYVAMIFAVLVMSMVNIGMAWGATTAPTGGPHTPGTTSTVTANGRNYEVFFSNNASTSSLLVGSNTSATTQATSTSGWCNIGSSCGNNNNNISTAFTLEEFVSNVKTSNNKAIRVQSTASSERNIVMVISGYDSIAVFGKSNDISVYAEIWNGSSYGASSALTLVGSKNQSSHYKRRFALDKTKQYRLTLAYQTSGSTNKDLVAFSLCVPAASCTAPSSVAISGTNKYFGGQDISLTATPSGGSGTPSYQWQKEINSEWTNVTNGTTDDVTISGATTNNLQITRCTHQNSGQYRCIVSTGATCSTTSSAYGVHVFSIYGHYYGGEYSHNEITWTSGTTGTATIHLNASSTYLFKVWSNDGYYYGNGSNNYIIQPINWDCGTGNDEMRLLTGPEGDYTFTVNVEHALDGSPYINLQLAYPTVTHPSTGYMYITKWWGTCYVHYWEGTNNDLSPWGYDPALNSDRYTSICGTNYWYFPVIDTYNKFIAKDAAGDPSNTTGDQVSTSHGGKYITHDGSWGWHDFSTYTISFNNGGGSGSMTSITGLCPNSNQTLPECTFTKTDYVFAGWHANVATKVGGSTIAAGGDIADEATLQEINSNITLTAQWTACLGPNYTAFNTSGVTDGTHSVGDALGTLSVTVSAQNGGTLSYQWYQYDDATGKPAAVVAAGTNNTASYSIPNNAACTNRHYYCIISESGCSRTVESAISGALTLTAPTLTAIEANTLYQAADMANITFNGSDQWFAGLSTNTKFKVYGNGTSTSAKGKTQNNSVTDDVDTKNFTSVLYLTAADNTSSSSDPTQGAIEFITPASSGTLYLYFGDTDSQLSIKEKGESSSTNLANSSNKYKKIDNVPANTHYFIQGSGSKRTFYGIKFVTCSDPAAPDGLAAGSITSDGVTFTITDDESPASYDIYYSTSSTAPTSGTAATTTSTTKTKAVTGLTVSTTYYAWVRAVCDASHKSAWVALTGSSFTTEAADCKVSLSKVVLTGTSSGTVTGYNTKEFAGDAVIGGLDGTQSAEVDASHDGTETGYKLNSKGSAIVFATLKNTSFHAGDVVKVTITKKNDTRTVDASTDIMTIYYGSSTSDAAALTTITGVSGAGTYSYTLTAANVTTIGNKKGIGVFRESSNGQNHYVYSVEILGCREHATVYNFSNGSFTDWGTCNGGTLTLSGSQSGVSYQLYKDGVASGDAKAGTGSALNWTVTASGTYTVKSVENATYAETAMTGSAAVTLQDPALSGANTVAVGGTITLTHPGYTIGGDNWVSSNPSVATVSNAGVVTGVAAGSVTITFHGVGACDGTKVITVTAPVTYTVTYDGNDKDGGSVPVDASSPYTSGSTVTVLGNTGSLTRTIDDAAATFYGWNTNSSGYGGTHYEAGNTFSITANTTLYAEWGFPITYNTDGGTINDLSYPTHYIYTGTSACTTTTLPENVTKSGYTFDGWYTQNGAGSLVTCISGEYTGAFAGDYALKAKWSEADGCEELVHTEAATATTLTTSVGSATLNSPSSQSNNEHAVKLNSSGYIELSPKAGKSFAVGDSLIVVVYNQASSTKTTGYKINGTEYEESVPSRVNHTMRKKLVAADIVSSKVKIERENDNGSSTYFVAIIIKHCEDIPTCTTPAIPSLSDQTVCPGSDIAAWNATVSNAAAITAAGEDVAYSWKKKGSDVELATTASFDLGSSATGGQAGTYVVKVTVSKAGYANATASAEVDLTVISATEEPSISADKAKVYEGDAVTLTATCGSTGVTYAWYTCAVDGTSAVATGSTSSTQSIASAPVPGTYYYKVVATGDGTHSCGFAEYIYTLVVSAPSECETHVWWHEGAPTGEVQADCFTFGATPTGSNGQSASMTIDGTTYNSTKRSSDWNNTIQFTVPADATATFYICGKGTGARTITLTDAESHTTTFSMTTTFGTFHSDEIGTGTWTMTTNGNLHIGMVALHVCVSSTCTDAVPTATATNAVVCSGTELSITATGYETSPVSIQWQKLNSSTSTWDDISGATSATYTVASAAAANAGSYRVVVTKECARTSNTVTIAVPSAPVFGEIPSSVSVMQTLALSISTVEASDAVSYKWYKSADATFDAGSDTEIGSAKNLIKAYADEAVGSPSYYVFCRATNSCGTTTSSAIAVNVTEYVEEDCAVRGNENDAEFGFANNGMSSGTYDSKNVWYKNSNSNYLTYTAPEGKYFATAKVTIASSNSSNASYQYSTDNGANWSSDVTISGLTTSLAEKTINLPANVTDFRIGRNLDGAGTSSGTFYLHKICFTYTNSCTTTTVTPSTSSKTHTIGDGFTEPTFTLTPAAVSGETLTYSSSDEDIATVDDDGTVTFQGMAGTVKIIASYAGGTIAAVDYCASEGYYTITVNCSAGAPKIVAGGSTNLAGCNTSVTLNAKTQGGADFVGGSYQWYRDGSEITGATGASITLTQTGVYTVEYTKDGCTSVSTNSATITSESVEPAVERLVPFQYYHVDKTYTAQMKMRHLFAVKNSAEYGSTGRDFKLELSRNGGATTDVTSSNAIEVWSSADRTIDTVMIDLNKLSGKYSENDELVFTCKAVDCEGNVSDVYKANITMHVIGATPTLALICSGSDKASGTRKTGELTVGGDFLTGYNKADLCEQTGNTSFDASTEWGLYTRLKANYIVTPVNGYAIFNKLNYEPFDILLLTDYPKASKSDAAKDVLDDMADLCDYRPMLSFKAHMVAKSPSKWAAKGFTTEPVAVKQGDGRTHLNIVCYAHPMFDGIKDASDHIFKDNSDASQIVYEMLTGPGHENSKGIQGFEIAAAENFVTIGLIHYNASVAEDIPSDGFVTWTPASGDRMLVAAMERQANPEARMVVLAVNCGAQSKFTETGRTIVHKCLQYLLTDYTITPMADCSFTFDNGAGSLHDADWYKNPTNCPGCTGTLGDGLWSTEANWGPDRVSLPGKDTEVKIAAPVQVDITDAVARSARIVEGGSISIPAGKALEIVGTIRRLDGSEISPTDNSDIFIGSTAAGNGTLIFNNSTGDSKATVAMYTTAEADVANMSAATSTWQYIGTPHTDVGNAQRNYYDSWLYQYNTSTEGWEVIPNGGPLVPFRGYCVTYPSSSHTFYMTGTLAATTSQDIDIPAGKYVVVANSWVAPIDINAITSDDMDGMTDKTIYFFNTGTDTEGTGGTGTAAGTYRATPINAASYTGDWQIPSMQGFYVVGGASDGTLHLDYNRHVRPSTSRSVVNNPMYAPKRYAENDEPEVAKLYFRGSRYYDRLVVLEREDFTRGYDSGWDGEAWGGNDASPMSYVSTEGRWDAVSAVPEYEGTVVGFRAGEDNEYTVDFEYSEENQPLYLYDTETKTYSRIVTGNAYYFTTSDKAYRERFILTRSNGQGTITGCDNIDAEGAKAKKFIADETMYILVNGMLYDATGKVVK